MTPLGISVSQPFILDKSNQVTVYNPLAVRSIDQMLQGFQNN